MVGIDIGPRGLVGGKLYFAIPKLRLGLASSAVGPVALLDEMARQGTEELINVLAVHRLSAPDDLADVPHEIHFGLAENELRWADISQLPSIKTACASGAPFADLQSSFRIAVRRLSAPVGEPNKLNVYYTLVERDPSVPLPNAPP